MRRRPTSSLAGDSSDSDAGAGPRHKRNRKTAVIGRLAFVDFHEGPRRKLLPPIASTFSLHSDDADASRQHRDAPQLRALSTEPIVPPQFKARQKQVLLLKSGKYSIEIMRRSGELAKVPRDVLQEAQALSRESGFRLGGSNHHMTIAEGAVRNDEANIVKALQRREVMQQARLLRSQRRQTNFGGESTPGCFDDSDDDRDKEAPTRRLLNDDLIEMELDEQRHEHPPWLRHVERAAAQSHWNHHSVSGGCGVSLPALRKAAPSKKH
jgi:hypothetical protein